VPPDPHELRRLNGERQYYFLPYYRDVVYRHPEGISAGDVKREVGEYLLREFGIDIEDPDHSGLNQSTGRSQADQWANNLISNRVLDEYMLVVRSGRALLYPGSIDNSRAEAPPGPALTAGQIADLDHRVPARIESRSSSAFQRSLQLADYVRSLSGRQCAVGSPSCVPFDGRDGRPYVEVHHVVPMAQQGNTLANLDRVLNMVPLCPRCHACLHRGQAEPAGEILTAALQWFSEQHGVSFADANADLGVNTSVGELLAMYGTVD